ncbi:MAG: YqeG family HAD IIIA-type phosphatase [Clostridia bacterium]|nr:YqeG family HAD IIIA-type phosphatase [Clostridia bacterium]MBR5923717.1 YqeG family HAD IIIA-type phosphatase [Clostridia bacterium]
MLLKPHLKLKRITDIELKHLKMLGVNTLFLDVDNTISTDHGTHLAEGLTEWMSKMQAGGVKLMILSNAKSERVKPFADKLGLDFIGLSLKPLPFGFFRGAKRAGVKRKNSAIVGDQIFTDTLGGRLSGVKVILLTPIELEKKLSFRIRRRLEKTVFRIHKIEDYKE